MITQFSLNQDIAINIYIYVVYQCNEILELKFPTRKHLSENSFLCPLSLKGHQTLRYNSNHSVLSSRHLYVSNNQFFCQEPIRAYIRITFHTWVCVCSRITQIIHIRPFFFLNFLENISFFWGHCYPCFGLMVMSALGFKSRVDPPLACSVVCMNGFLRFHIRLR